MRIGDLCRYEQSFPVEQQQLIVFLHAQYAHHVLGFFFRQMEAVRVRNTGEKKTAHQFISLKSISRISSPSEKLELPIPLAFRSYSCSTATLLASIFGE